MTNSRPNPYVGPRAFRPGEPFYGRDRELRSLSALLIAERIVLLHSPSGSGKTSLIQAGLLPRLRDEGFNILPTIRVNQDPPAGLSVNRYVFSTLLALEENLPDDQCLPLPDLAALTLDDYLTRRPRPESASQSDVLIFDQFEEVLTFAPTDREGKLAFFEQLGRALRNKNRWALVAIREDYLGALAPYTRPIPGHFSATFRLDLLGVEGALQAIQKPVQAQGATFVTTAAQKLVDDLRRIQAQLPDGSLEEQLGPYVEPVQLQVVCLRLWQGLDEADMLIDEVDLAAVGNVNRSLADYYASSVKNVAEKGGVSERSIREWFAQRLITPDGIRGQVLMGAESSEGLPNPVVRLVENAHIIRGEKRAGKTWFELSHDRLIKPVRDDNSAWFAANMRLFQQQAGLWAQQGRPEGLLLRGAELAQAETESEKLTITPAEADFLAACRKLREREQRDRRQRQFIVAGLVTSLVLLVIAIFFGISANVASQRARAGELAAQSAAWQGKNFRASLLLGVEAFRLLDNVQTRGAVVDAAHAQPSLLQLLAGHTSDVWGVAFSPDGKTLASASSDKSILLWDVAARQRLGPPLTAHTDIVTSVAFSPDGQTLASASWDQTIILWDVATRQPLGQPLAGHLDRVLSVAFSPDGKTLASGGRDNKVILWDVATRQPLGQPLAAHLKRVTSVAFSPDGRTLASASWDQTIILWDVATGQALGQPLAGHTNYVNAVAFSPDGRLLASASDDKTVILWDLATRQPLAHLSGHTDYVWTVAFSPDGQILVSGSADGKLVQWDVATYQRTGQLLAGHTNFVTSVAFSPDGRLIASGSWDRTVILWDVATALDKSVSTRPPSGQPLLGAAGPVRAVAFRPDGKMLASGSEDKTIRLWDVETAQLIGQPLAAHTAEVRSVVFSPDGQTLASGGSENAVFLWDVATRQPIGQALVGHTGAVTSLAFSPDGRLLASGSADKTIVIWDTTTRESVAHLVGHTEAVYSVAFSPDGKLLASGSRDTTVILWDVAAQKALAEPLQGHQDWVDVVTFSPDGKLLASGSDDNTIILWDVATRQPAGQPLTGHTNFVYGLAFSSDGQTLASGSADKTIILWNLATRQAIGQPFTGHKDAVRGVAFSPDGNLLASGGDDSAIILWDVNLPSWIKQSCQRAGGNLTRAEWKRYGFTEPYRATCPQWPLEPEPTLTP